MPINVKAREIVYRAYKEVVQSKSEPSDADLHDGLRYLNRMMASFEVDGVALGYTKLSSIDDVVTVPATCILGMVKNLAVKLWPQYTTIAVNPVLDFSASRSYKMMQSQAINVVEQPLSLALSPLAQEIIMGFTEMIFTINNLAHRNI